MKCPALLAATVMAAPALADTPMPLTYEVFETAVAHVDLQTCPAELARDGVFCRATLNHDEVHVFAFSFDGDSPMIGFATYPMPAIPAGAN